MGTRKNALIIPVVTLLLVVAILLNIPIFRNVIVFAYLSFVPGFAILRTLKLKEITLLKALLLSVALSLAASMFIGFLVNELYVILGLSKPLSIIPLTVAMSVFSLVVSSISYRRDFPVSFVSLDGVLKRKNYLLLTLVLLFLPILSIVGALYVNIPIMIFLYLAITVLCILSVVSSKIIPTEFHPFLIFSISISIILLNVLPSKYIIGDDASGEYYLFKIIQIRGYWGSIDAATNYANILAYNSMLSVTLLPNVYSVLMNLQGEMLFKILYPFVFSLVPLALYEIYKNETGKLIGLMSTFFVIFSVNAFFGEPLGVNRQVVGTFFLVLSILLWLDKTFPITEKRILLVIFGVSLAVSHYSLAVVYVIFISLVVFISSRKPKFDEVFSVSTVVAIFVGTFLWEAFSPGSNIITIIDFVQRAIAVLNGFTGDSAGSASIVYALPQVFTAASWVNLIVTGVVILSAVMGILVVALFSRRMGISDNYRWITIFGAVIWGISYLFPSIAATLNFTRLYGMALLFWSPCFTIGVLYFLNMIRSTIRKRNGNSKNDIVFLHKKGRTALLLVALLVCASFLSQSGFINYVTDGGIKGTRIEYYRMKTSNNPQILTQFYGTFMDEHDVFSAVWLSKYADASAIFYSDYVSHIHVLSSVGLIPLNLIRPLTNTTTPEKGSFIYLDSLNVEKGIIPVVTGTRQQYLNTSEISFILHESDLIYSNGESEIWSAAGSG